MSEKNNFHRQASLNPEPPQDLLGRVISKIDRERQLARIKRKLWVSSAIFIMSALLALPVFNLFKEQIVRSGFAQYLSLLFSDLHYLIDDWQDSMLSLLEALPALATVLLLLVIFAMTLSVEYITKYLKSIQRLSKLNYH